MTHQYTGTISKYFTTSRDLISKTTMSNNKNRKNIRFIYGPWMYRTYLHCEQITVFTNIIPEIVTDRSKLIFACFSKISKFCELYDFPDPNEIKKFRVILEESSKGIWKIDSTLDITDIETDFEIPLYRVGLGSFFIVKRFTNYHLWVEYVY